MSESQTSVEIWNLLAELVSYPVLRQHEETLNKRGLSGLYDVSAWFLYLQELDALVEAMNEKIQSSSLASTRRVGGRLTNVSVNIGGRDIVIVEITVKRRLLLRCRNLVSERALLLLPGSYKLWKDYLDVRSRTFMLSQSLEDDATRPYQLHSTDRMCRYRSTISAYERSMVRMNKYPRIWLSYIAFVIRNDPSCSVTNIRRLFNRALLALPATQHDLIWSEYLCFILGRVPPSGFIASRSSIISSSGVGGGPVIQLCKQGLLSPESFPGIVPQETTLRVLRRYARYYNPTARELLVDVALDFERYGEAASLLVEILNDVDFHSVQGTSRHDLWMKLADVCMDHPDSVEKHGIDFEAIIRAALQTSYTVASVTSRDKNGDNSQPLQEDDEENDKLKRLKSEQEQLQASLGEIEGSLWAKLAQFYVTKGEFEMARSIYEESMEKVSRVRDFCLIFDAYVKFEEGVIEALVELMDESDHSIFDPQILESEEQDDNRDWDILMGLRYSSSIHHSTAPRSEQTQADVELALARTENLMSRRPLLLNRVLLRQNQNNVGEWLKRSDMYLKLNDGTRAVGSLEEAVRTVNPRHAVNGSPAHLYIKLASLHENEMNDITSARSVYKRICCPSPEYLFNELDELAQCFTSWAEMELRVKNWDGALSVARLFLASSFTKSPSKVAKNLTKSVRLWNLLFDLEESLGTVQTTKNAYNRAIETKVVTPTHILNFASYLTEHNYFEESFTVYERGVELFAYPHEGGRLLWNTYLRSFQDRYGGSKTSRMRELFDRCLEGCPAEIAADFYLMYGSFEEQFGLTKRALGVYERMCTVVPSDEKFTAYKLYIAKTAKYLGTTATRPIYERAITALEDVYAADICCDYAKMEATLQELDRARAAFTFGSQLADPRQRPEYWKEWHEFEVTHGNEETFREMLRIKRGVQAAFSTVNYNASGVATSERLTDDEALEMIAKQEGININENERISGFVQAKRTAEINDLEEVERRAAKLRRVTTGVRANQMQAGNEEEINLDENEIGGDEVSDSKKETIQAVTTKSVPLAVFGGLSSAIEGH